MDNEKLNIYQRIVGVMSDLDYIQKGDKRVNNQYRFVSHDQTTAALHPMLVKHGIVMVPTVKSIQQDGNRTCVCMNIKYVNADDPNDFVEIESWGYGIDQADKGPGKAVSYACKYAILKMFCLETGDDPDNDATSQHKPKEEAPKVTISIEESFELMMMLDKLPEYKAKVLAFLTKQGINKIENMTKEMYNNAMNQARIELRKLEENNGI